MPGRLERIRQICLSLPEAEERLTWDHPTFRVRDKIIASCPSDGSTIGFKADPEELDALLYDERFEPSAYTGRYGWVTMTLAGRVRWREVKELVHTSYVMIAPKMLGRLVMSGQRRH